MAEQNSAKCQEFPLSRGPRTLSIYKKKVRGGGGCSRQLTLPKIPGIPYFQKGQGRCQLHHFQKKVRVGGGGGALDKLSFPKMPGILSFQRVQDAVSYIISPKKGVRSGGWGGCIGQFTLSATQFPKMAGIHSTQRARTLPRPSIIPQNGRNSLYPEGLDAAKN